MAKFKPVREPVPGGTIISQENGLWTANADWNGQIENIPTKELAIEILALVDTVLESYKDSCYDSRGYC